MKRNTTCIGLLRGINVGGHNKIPMAELRSLLTAMGWKGVQTYIQSGNLVFTSAGIPAAIEADLEHAIRRHFGLQIPVLVRAAAAWSHYTETNPFPEAAKAEPQRVMLALAKAPLKPDAASALQERAASGEKIVQAGDALWMHFPRGIGTSRLSPPLLDRLAGSPVTTRNWLTVLKLREMSGHTAT